MFRTSSFCGHYLQWTLISAVIGATVGAMSGCIGAAVLDDDIKASTRATAVGAVVLSPALFHLNALLDHLQEWYHQDPRYPLAEDYSCYERLPRFVNVLILSGLYFGDMIVSGVLGRFFEKHMDNPILDIHDQAGASAGGALLVGCAALCTLFLKKACTEEAKPEERFILDEDDATAGQTSYVSVDENTMI